MINCQTCPNQKCYVFHDCSPEWIRIIDSTKEQTIFKKGQQIIREGDKVTGLYFIQEGKVKIISNGINGKEQIVRLAADGYVIGHCAFSGETYPVGAITLDDTRACFVSNEILKQAYLDNPPFVLSFMKYYSAELRKMEMRLKYLAQMSIREKVAEAITYLFDTFGINPATQVLNVHLSRQELADLIGTNAEQVTRQLTIFEEEKILVREGKELKLLDLDLLKKIIIKYN